MKVLKYLTIALIAGLVLYGLDAFAQDANALTRTSNVLQGVFKGVRNIFYVLGCFGLIAIAIGGLMGKINFKWLAYLAAGLAIVAAADVVVRFATNAGGTGTVTDNSSLNLNIK